MDNIFLIRTLKAFRTTAWKTDEDQDKAPARISVVVMAAVRESGFEPADHPPYSQDLAPCDYCLFPNTKESLSWEAVLDRLRTFSRVRMGAQLLNHGNKSSTPMGEVNGLQGRLC